MKTHLYVTPNDRIIAIDDSDDDVTPVGINRSLA